MILRVRSRDPGTPAKEPGIDFWEPAPCPGSQGFISGSRLPARGPAPVDSIEPVILRDTVPLIQMSYKNQELITRTRAESKYILRASRQCQMTLVKKPRASLAVGTSFRSYFLTVETGRRVKRARGVPSPGSARRNWRGCNPDA